MLFMCDKLELTNGGNSNVDEEREGENIYVRENCSFQTFHVMTLDTIGPHFVNAI